MDKVTMREKVICDVCHKKWASFYGKTTTGPWAYMCVVCFARYGIGLGMGKGQKLNVEVKDE